MANKSKSSGKNIKKGAKVNTAFKKEPTANIQFKQVVRDERTKKIVGFFFVLTAVFLGISFISYFFTWKQDFVQATRGWSIINDLSISVDNLMGKLGLLSAHVLIYKYFGIGAILICTFFFVVGINLLFRRRVFSVTRNLKYVTLGTLILCVYAAFFIKTANFPWGGGVGNALSS
ncbi:MAG: DNA translocase FtsK, partial [Chitinophagaceae bacterium]